MQDIPIPNIERETVQLEHKCKQMREWKNNNSSILRSHDYALKVSRRIREDLCIYMWEIACVQKSKNDITVKSNELYERGLNEE